MKLVLPDVNGKLACSSLYYSQHLSRCEKILEMRRHEIFSEKDSEMEEGDISDQEDIDPFELFRRGRLEIHGDTAILRIEGFLSQNSSFWETEFNEGTSYESTLWALHAIDSDASINRLLVLVDSGGGEVAGLSTVTDLMQEVSLRLEGGSFGFTSSLAASAAYAILISNLAVIADPWAILGSIGVVEIFMTEARFLEEHGIDVYVARSGERKMTPSPFEPLTEQGKEILDEEVSELSELFFEMVETARGSISSDDWKSGRTYSAARAAEINMIDTIMTFTELQERINFS